MNDSDESKMNLWSTKSEFLNMQMMDKKNNETWEDVRQRGFDCLRYLNKCSKLNSDNEEYPNSFSIKITSSSEDPT